MIGSRYSQLSDHCFHVGVVCSIARDIKSKMTQLDEHRLEMCPFGAIC